MTRYSTEQLAPNPFNKGTFSWRAYDYALSVLTGRRIAGRYVRLAALRFIRDLERKPSDTWKYHYEPLQAEATCTLFEIFVHEKGPLMEQPVRIGDWQCFVFCNMFGWLNRESGLRRFRQAFVLIPKGNGKSPMAAWVSLKLGFWDGQKGAEVYCVATTEDQAFEVFRVAKGIMDLLPSLRKRMGIVSKPKMLYQPRTRSRVRPLPSTAKDGKAPSGVTNDEWHEAPDDTLRDSLKNAMDKRPNTLLFDISTAGDNIEGPCYQKQQEVQDILLNVEDPSVGYADERQFAIIYDVDENVEWHTREACEMANPNFGVSMQIDETLESLAEAVRNPAKQNDFRTKRQNFWVGQLMGWMNMESWRRCIRQIKPEDFIGIAGYHGSDLASKIDLCGTALLFVRPRESDGRPIYTVFAKAYLPERRVNDKTRQNLQAWHKQGFLIATAGGAIDYEKIENDTIEDIETFDIRELAYDDRYAGQYAQRVANRTGVIRFEVAPNPAEISPAMKELEAAIEDDRFEHDGHPVLTWCMGNVLCRSNQATGNYHMPSKDRPDKKIDLAMALIIAMARARFCLGSQAFIDPKLDWI